MRLLYRFIGIISALDFLRATQGLRQTVARLAPEGASQEEAIRATKDLPEVKSAKQKMFRELGLLVAAEFVVLGAIVYWVLT